jgi:hypothetical protein
MLALYNTNDSVTLWHATDEMLARPVGIYLIPEDHDLAESVVAAAQAASMIDDPRFVRILDAVRSEGNVYVVHEWLPQARTLRVVLAEDGPLPPDDAQRMITDAAQALTVAHTAGLAHLRLQPDTVLITRSAQLKIFGLCLEAALHGTTATDPARKDARGLGRVLYAMLTAKWPEGEAFGLPAAPYENGAICTPRQVRAGVPDRLDATVDRVLNARPRSGTPIRSPADLADALHPGRTVRSPAAAATADHTATHTFAAPRPPGPDGRGWRPSGATRGAQIGVVLVLVLGLALLGWQIVRAVGSGGSGQDTPAASPMHTIPIADVIDFDPPPGDNNENPEQAPLAVDGKPDTAWRTNRYRTWNFNKTKSGVGLIFDLGHAQVVRQVKLILPLPGESLQIRTAGASVTSAPLDLDSYLGVTSAENVGLQDTLRFPFATNTRFLLVWITKLPRDGGGYRGGISEVTVSG